MTTTTTRDPSHDLTRTDPTTDLTIRPEQTSFDDRQVAALQHMGIGGTPSPADLAVFFHVVRRSGLDPFARQIYLIGRNTKTVVNGREQWAVKYTIQTGIDGFRLIGRRAADRSRETISMSAPEWIGKDGNAQPVWSSEWGYPLAARITIYRNGQPFTGIALFDEYKQVKGQGLTSMWRQRPAGMIAKCAEALAWRMAFPQDLSGLYTEEEMQAADNADQENELRAAQPSALAAVQHAAAAVTGEVINAETDPAEAALGATPEDQRQATARSSSDRPARPDVPPEVAARADTLRRKFEGAGITDGAAMIAYCRNALQLPELRNAYELTQEQHQTITEQLAADADEAAAEAAEQASEADR